jgi:hypothetical protein
MPTKEEIFKEEIFKQLLLDKTDFETKFKAAVEKISKIRVERDGKAYGFVFKLKSGNGVVWVRLEDEYLSTGLYAAQYSGRFHVKIDRHRHRARKEGWTDARIASIAEECVRRVAESAQTRAKAVTMQHDFDTARAAVEAAGFGDFRKPVRVDVKVDEWKTRFSVRIPDVATIEQAVEIAKAVRGILGTTEES